MHVIFSTIIFLINDVFWFFFGFFLRIFRWCFCTLNTTLDLPLNRIIHHIMNWYYCFFYLDSSAWYAEAERSVFTIQVDKNNTDRMSAGEWVVETYYHFAVPVTFNKQLVFVLAYKILLLELMCVYASHTTCQYEQNYDIVKSSFSTNSWRHHAQSVSAMW